MSILRITGSAPGLPLWFVAAGDMAASFRDSYSVHIDAKDKSQSDSGPPGQTPHPPDMNYDYGNFESTSFTVKLFSGALVNGTEIYTGQAIVTVAETLFKLSLPRAEGNTFNGPPLVTVQYGAWWRARGLFQKATMTSEGSWDERGYPTIVELELEFARHFGGGAHGGIYDRAKRSDLIKATSAKDGGFKFKS